MNKRVLTVGDVNIDIVLGGLPRMPEPEQDIIASQMDILVGGQTSTLSRALARLGFPVFLVARVGNDFFGERVRTQLAADSVDTSGIIIDPDHATGATIVLSKGRERAFATYGGTLFHLRREDIPQDVLAGSNHLHLGSFYYHRRLRPYLEELFSEAKALGLTTSMDPGWDPENLWADDILKVLKYIDVFIPNQTEAMHVSGEDSLEAAIENLTEYAGTVVVKMGSGGCLVRDGGSTHHVPSFEVKVEDVTSAGDVFNAGYLYGFLQGWDVLRCARFGNACGAIAVSRIGSEGIMRGVDEVEEFLIQHAS